MHLSAEQILTRCFLPLYPPDTVRDAGTLAHARKADANPAGNPQFSAHLRDAAERFQSQAAQLFEGDLSLDFTDASIHRLSAALSVTVRERWRTVGTGDDNLLFNAVVHGAAYVGECIVRNHGGRWEIRRPLWESLVALQSAAGDAELAVFHWLIKALADNPPSSLADRYRAYVELPSHEPLDLPRLFGSSPVPRKAPRLTKVRYSALFQFMKSHFSEIRDLGSDFPSPERFDELAFRWLDSCVVGDGRMVVLFGPSEHGVHLFWLAGNGFHASMFFPTDAPVDPTLSLDEKRLVVGIPTDHTPQKHELLWWGR